MQAFIGGRTMEGHGEGGGRGKPAEPWFRVAAARSRVVFVQRARSRSQENNADQIISSIMSCLKDLALEQLDYILQCSSRARAASMPIFRSADTGFHQQRRREVEAACQGRFGAMDVSRRLIFKINRGEGTTYVNRAADLNRKSFPAPRRGEETRRVQGQQSAHTDTRAHLQFRPVWRGESIIGHLGPHAGWGLHTEIVFRSTDRGICVTQI
ncbi:hypothetical protein J6590_036710 [Homalodisca vitripennis]|nr:hypothetical protein J6590_036710 [Homalodisca vitripennis]